MALHKADATYYVIAMRKMVVAVVAVLSGCTTVASMDAAEDARFRSFKGMTVAQFSQATGLAPYDAYSVSGGKVFVVNGPPATIVLPAAYGAPAVARDATCRILLTTKPAAGAAGLGTADDWVITTIARSGGCANV